MMYEVFRLPRKEWFVCFDSDRGWVCRFDDTNLWFFRERGLMPALPILESAWPEMRRQVDIARKDLRIQESFPFESLVLYALQWPTDYWPGLVVDWIAQGFPTSESVLQGLQLIASKKYFPQRLRHRASALIVKARRMGDQQSS